MGGYKVQRTGYKVRIEAHPGLEVVVRPLSVEEILAFNRLVGSISDVDPDKPDTAQLAAFEKVLHTFGALLESWNLEEDDDTPIPAGWAGLKTLGLPFAMEIIQASMEAISQAPRPLSPSSTNGPDDAELRELLGSIPMSPIGQ